MASILIVEDELIVAEDLAMSVKDLGHTVAAAVSSAEQAIELVEGAQPDLILMDINLGEGMVDGIEAAERIRSRFDVPVVYVTAFTDPESLERAKRTEPYGYVAKPFSLSELRSTIETALYKHDADRRIRRSEAKYRTLMETAVDGFFLLDDTARLLEVNDAYCRMSGYSRDELLRMSVNDLEALESPEEIASHLVRVMEHGYDRFETVHRKKDGSLLHIEASVQFIQDEEGGRFFSIVRDVGFRKRAEEALRKSEERYRLLADNAVTGVYVHKDDLFVYANERLCTMLGYSGWEILTKRFWEIFSPDIQSEIKNRGRARYAGEDVPRQYEARVLTREGETRWVEVSAVLVDYYGRPATMGTITDITERRRAEESLRLERARLQALLELNEMAETSPEQIMDFALEKAVELTRSEIGYFAYADETETVLTMHSWSRLGLQQCRIDEKPIVYPVEKTGLWGEAVRRRRPIITNDYSAPNPLKKGYPEGHVDIVRHMNLPVFDADRIVLVAGVGNKPEDYDETDVRQLSLLMQGMWRLVERRRIQAKLKESESKFRTLFERAGDGIMLMGTTADEWGKIVSANPAAAAMHGYEIEELIGLDMRTLDVPEEAGRMTDDINRLLKGKTVRIEHRHYKKDGTEFPVELSAGLIELGGKTYVLSIHRDITETKEIRSRIEASLNEKEALLREIHHRVKNNLAVVHALLGLQADRVSDAEHAEMFEESRRRIRSMALAHELLYQSDNLLEIRAPEYLGQLVDHLTGPIAGIGGRVSLVKEIEDVGLPLDTAIPLGLIVTELVSNAVKHAFPNGREGEIRLALCCLDGEELELTAADNGVGIPEDVHIDNSPSLGLELVDTFAQQLRGEVRIIRDKGTEIRVRLKAGRHQR